jgi:hypothetical protein
VVEHEHLHPGRAGDIDRADQQARILIVEFANQLREERGLSVREAIEEAAAIRLRPVLMTTAAMVFGMVPLILATGAGAVSRFDIGGDCHRDVDWHAVYPVCVAVHLHPAGAQGERQGAAIA